MGNDWQNWSEMVGQAAVIIAAVGISVAAALELIKQIYKAISGRDMPAELMTIGSAVVSVAIAAIIMVQSGCPWYVAVLVCLAAIWAPKLAHDGMGRLKPIGRLTPPAPLSRGPNDGPWDEGETP